MMARNKIQLTIIFLLIIILTGCSTYDYINFNIMDFIFASEKENEKEPEKELKKELEEYITETPQKKSDNKQLMLKLRRYLFGRFKEFDYEFSGTYGISVRQTQDNQLIYGKNSDKCLIPASLTKIILCSALVERLNNSEIGLNIEEAFIKKTNSLKWNKFSGMSLIDLFKSMNVYNYSEANKANQIAEQTGEFLKLMEKNNYKTKTGDILFDHLNNLSNRKSCNKIEKSSGLSIHNSLTPSQITDCLYFLKNTNSYTRSLQKRGQGTLSNRLIDIGDKHLFKTGSLRQSGVLCLAGFLDPPQGIHFTIIINKIKSQEYERNIQWIDDMVRGMLAILGLYTPNYTSL